MPRGKKNRVPTPVTTTDALLDERGKTHGDFADHAAVTWAIKDAITSLDNSDKFSLVQREALDMIAHKIGRIVAGNPNFADHWLDLSGYAMLVVRDLEK